MDIFDAEKINNIGHRTALFYVLVSTKMPAALFEASYLSNEEDERRLRSPHFQQQLAEALAESVEQWISRQE